MECDPTLVVGLGNPGPRYDATRHNLGFMAIDRIAETEGISLDRTRWEASFGRGRIGGREVILAKPLAYMNRSGPPTSAVARFFKISSKAMIVIHDDIDLAYGRIKIKEKGGHGGHNGLKSMIEAFGNGDFTRIRIGIGRPDTGNGVTGHVLGKFHSDEWTALDRIIERSREAAVSLLCHGAKESMNVFNRKDSVNLK